MWLRARLPRLLPLALLACAGCGVSARDATEKQLAEMRREIARLTERVGMLELERGPGKADAVTTGTSPPYPGAAGADAAPLAPGEVPKPPAAGARADRDRPELDVVRISPSEGDGDADNEASRPAIKATGDGRTVLNNKSAARGVSKKGVAAVPAKKPGDGDARPVVKP